MFPSAINSERWKRALPALLLALILAWPAKNLNAARQPKDPFLAGVLSWSWTGLGQFYAQDYTSGSMFVAIDLLETGSLVYLFLNFSAKYTNDETGDNTIEWREIQPVDKGLAVGLAFLMVAIKGWSIYDAVRAAENYNQNLVRGRGGLAATGVPGFESRRVGFLLSSREDPWADQTVNMAGVSYSF